jgi:hypothetical protein
VRMSPPPLFPVDVDDPPRNRVDVSASREESSERWLRLHSFQSHATEPSRDESGDKTSEPTPSCSDSRSDEYSKRRKRVKRKEREERKERKERRERKERKEKRLKEEKHARLDVRDDECIGIRERDAKTATTEENRDRSHRERRSQATKSSAL